MNKQLQIIVDETQVKFGLDAYRLERYSIYKERDSTGAASFIINMEWFPKELNEPIEEDYKPVGTAIVEYSIQKKHFSSVSFVQGKSYSIKTHFPGQTAEEVAAWLEEETGLVYKRDFKLTEASLDGFRFESDIGGFPISPNSIIEVEFDEVGKLISYHSYGEIPSEEHVLKSKFTLTLEEIESIVKKQLQLVNYPSETENRFIPVYAMEEVYVTVDGARIIPFMELERSDVKVDEIMVWDEPLKKQINREEIIVVSEASVEEAFSNSGVDENRTLSAEQIKYGKNIVRDVLRSEYPTESGIWKLSKLRRQESFIEAHCEIIEEVPSLFKRKVIIFMNPETMTVLNLLDNESMFEIFDAFAPAEKAVTTHEEAFEKMVPYITLDPTYVFDGFIGKYVLCGLLDAAEAVDAVSGEVISLMEI
ncbi:hypothetical protein [Sporosarcina sp. JAI121]|uniref:hypothetical protein n=1 Tax=Sporosarcina sp. JAI121 TaxID=2723064 RepID=UPI0015CA72FC|nr:hypothetical protein [Sporosarcina sp. JAI121]NYF25256.1 hypothetical protein [Sporosarcina sp. JAI121]